MAVAKTSGATRCNSPRGCRERRGGEIRSGAPWPGAILRRSRDGASWQGEALREKNRYQSRQSILRKQPLNARETQARTRVSPVDVWPIPRALGCLRSGHNAPGCPPRNANARRSPRLVLRLTGINAGPFWRSICRWPPSHNTRPVCPVSPAGNRTTRQLLARGPATLLPNTFTHNRIRSSKQTCQRDVPHLWRKLEPTRGAGDQKKRGDAEDFSLIRTIARSVASWSSINRGVP